MHHRSIAWLTAAAGLLVGGAAPPARAQLIPHKDLSLAIALAIATAAADHCKAQGYTVSVAVVGREAQTIVQLRGDGSPPHSEENSYRRAYTALTYRRPSLDVEQRLRADPSDQLARLNHVMAAQGGLPSSCRATRSAPSRYPAHPAAGRTKPAPAPGSTRQPAS